MFNAYWNRTSNNTILVASTYSNNVVYQNIYNQYWNYLASNKNITKQWLNSTSSQDSNVVNILSIIDRPKSNSKLLNDFQTSIIVNKTLYLSPGIMADPSTYETLNYGGTSYIWNTNTQLKHKPTLYDNWKRKSPFKELMEEVKLKMPLNA